MNTLVKQNDEQATNYLASMREIYAQAKKYWGTTLAISIVLLPLLSVYVTYNQVYAAYFALLSIFLLILNSILILVIKYYVKLAASIQELFDSYVFNIQTNPLLIENEDIKEIITKWSDKYIQKYGTEKLKDWYAKELQDKPQQIAVLTAQRINSWWDESLRLSYTIALTILAIILIACMFIVGLLNHLSLEEFIMTVMLPSVPIMQLVIVEVYKNYLAKNRANKNLKRAKELLRISKSKTVKSREIRSLQDSIFIHRTESPLIFDFIYRISQKSKEKLMKRSSS